MLILTPQRYLELNNSFLHAGFFTMKDVESLAKEMLKMKDFKHPHVMSLTGVCLDAGAGVSVVMPFMANGSLLDYLKRERETLDLTADTETEKVWELHVTEILPVVYTVTVEPLLTDTLNKGQDSEHQMLLSYSMLIHSGYFLVGGEGGESWNSMGLCSSFSFGVISILLLRF